MKVSADWNLMTFQPMSAYVPLGSVSLIGRYQIIPGSTINTDLGPPIYASPSVTGTGVNNNTLYSFWTGVTSFVNYTITVVSMNYPSNTMNPALVPCQGTVSSGGVAIAYTTLYNYTRQSYQGLYNIVSYRITAQPQPGNTIGLMPNGLLTVDHYDCVYLYGDGVAANMVQCIFMNKP